MATSKLQRLFGDMLDKRLPEYTIRENFRPDWLISSDCTRLELDFYIEELNIAFEVQGDQHFGFIPFFHKTQDDYKKGRQRDEEKRVLCYGRRIRLIEIMTAHDAEIAIKNIEEKIKRETPKYHYQEWRQDEIPERQFTKKEWRKEKTRKIQERIKLGLTKRQNKNSDSEKQKRLALCKRNIELYETGKLQATLEKVEYWKRVVADNGYAVIE